MHHSSTEVQLVNFDADVSRYSDPENAVQLLSYDIAVVFNNAWTP